MEKFCRLEVESYCVNKNIEWQYKTQLDSRNRAMQQIPIQVHRSRGKPIIALKSSLSKRLSIMIYFIVSTQVPKCDKYTQTHYEAVLVLSRVK